jgi:hypothetical protein
VAVVEEYDKRSLFHMLLKSYHHLHPLSEVESPFLYINDENINLYMFEMVVNTNELVKELVN